MLSITTITSQLYNITILMNFIFEQTLLTMCRQPRGFWIVVRDLTITGMLSGSYQQLSVEKVDCGRCPVFRTLTWETPSEALRAFVFISWPWLFKKCSKLGISTRLPVGPRFVDRTEGPAPAGRGDEIWKNGWWTPCCWTTG